jgi:hypothetical protein
VYNVPNIIFSKRLNLGTNTIDKQIINAGIININAPANNVLGEDKKSSPLIIRSTFFGTYN